jgi:hypothetical protein
LIDDDDNDDDDDDGDEQFHKPRMVWSSSVASLL